LPVGRTAGTFGTVSSQSCFGLELPELAAVLSGASLGKRSGKSAIVCSESGELPSHGSGIMSSSDVISAVELTVLPPSDQCNGLPGSSMSGVWRSEQ